jgi:hypothetical protein
MPRTQGTSLVGLVMVLCLCIFTGDVSAATVAERAAAAEELVQEALHREIYGLQQERDRLLQEALDLKPDYAPAKWHLGFVRFQNEWVPADIVPQYANRNLRRVAYERLRDEQPDTVSGNLTIANWCREKKLFDEERAHLTRVVDLAPDHQAARRRLGFRLRDGRWVEDAALQAIEQRRREIAQGMAKWRPALEKLRNHLQQRSAMKRTAAAETIRNLDDPAAIPAMENVLSTHSSETANVVLEALSQMPDQEAVESLIRHAVQSPWREVRDNAAEHLKQRKRECYVPTMLAEMYTPVVTRTIVMPTGRGEIGYRHLFARESQDQRQIMILDTAYQRVALPGGVGQESLSRILRDSSNRVLSREWNVAQANRTTQSRNERIAAALTAATGEQLPATPQAWWDWWNQENDVVVQGEKQTRTFQDGTQLAVVDQVTVPTQTGNGFPQFVSGPRQRRAECFAAGTVVWTSTGLLSIEEVRVGDRVLSQNIDSGELAFKPVLRTTVRPQEPLFQVQIGEDTFRTTAGHLFWVSGRGWLRARDLRPGMQIHTVGGGEMVVEVEEGTPSAETHNLVVADFRTYFVGNARVLSHDVTNRRPTLAVVPGLSDR